MIQEIKKYLVVKFPLVIKCITWDEYNLNICGEGWSFNTTSCWRLISGKGFFGIDDTESQAEVKTLEGKVISEIESFGNLNMDISFKFADDTLLQIFCTSYFEPWVFNIEGFKTFVASYDAHSRTITN